MATPNYNESLKIPTKLALVGFTLFTHFSNRKNGTRGTLCILYSHPHNEEQKKKCCRSKRWYLVKLTAFHDRGSGIEMQKDKINKILFRGPCAHPCN